MPSLKDLQLESVYSSEEMNILEDFYLPALSASNEYLRITGFFSSESFAVAAKGISGLLRNEGKMKLITGIFSKKEDILVAEEAINNPDKLIHELEQQLSINDIENVFVKESIKAFGWMLAKGLLEIKVAIPKDKNFVAYPSLFHQKIGILIDGYCNKLSFSGSINETGVGWLNNIEEFKVFRNWYEDEKKYYYSDEARFFKFWNNVSDNVEMIPLPEAIKDKIIRYSPKNIEDLDFPLLEVGPRHETETSRNKVKEIKLRDYQQLALDSWEKNEFKGIVEMATGSGKTFVGISSILKCLNLVDAGIVLVSAPTMEICNQWKKDIIEYIEYDSLIVVNSSENKWNLKLENALHDYEKNRLARLILITTYGSLGNLFSLFLNYDTSNVLLVADEVHSFGSKERSKILNDKEFKTRIKYRLGLSATPERNFDQLGTDLLKSYFGDIIFNYGIGDAINDKVLCPYNYHLSFVEMSKDEIDDYKDLSKKISKISHYASIENDNEKLTSLLNKRARIIKKCENKLIHFRNVINDLIKENNIAYTFVFCIDSNQLKNVKKHLDDLNVCYSQITGKENSDERKKIIKEFEKGNIDVLLSMGILDEGINIPNAKNAIILSSSTNPREYVQRRGRVLRISNDENKVANIYDFIVIPPFDNILGDVYELEKSIVRKELMRSFLFVKYSKNKLDIFSNVKLKNIIKFFELSEIYNLLR